ncbi:MAG: P-loop NTPase [Planctomycetes bacterium]|nr:P-loop NTPase [Planctomycetota bacterium]
MIITIASGKGGTGKTTVATNLADVARDNVQLLDCDVEEPNCHIFIPCAIEKTIPVKVMVPEVDPDKCTGNGKCGEICRFNAIVALKTKPLIFPELCHSCRGCVLVCPEKALTEGHRVVGVIEIGHTENLEFITGRLRISEAMSPPLIREVKKYIADDKITIIDAPPGTSCPVIEAIKGSDYVVLVTEPTPFGLNDLKLAVAMVRQMQLPFGVLINRCGMGDQRVHDYCRAENIKIIMEIPDDRRIAEAYSSGQRIARVIPGLQEKFEELINYIKIETALHYERISNH